MVPNGGRRACALGSTYNLFRRWSEPGVVCAVPETEPVPGFIDEGWEFCGRVSDASGAPLGFQPSAAPGAVRRGGFYVFHDFRFPRTSSERPVTRSRSPEASLVRALGSPPPLDEAPAWGMEARPA